MPVWGFIFKVMAWTFLVCIVAQVFIAGIATFSDTSSWETHKSFVKIFALAPLLMFLLTFVGRIKGPKRWVSLGLFVLVVFQFLSIQVFSSTGIIAALHPVIALLLFWGSVKTV
ncbi:hypothetical protein GCM10008018_08630 [Paenibacillus marchantiophytorum]|uniref:Uncharacterized protein n=1 Tax=Paenibacillus marchantiophytorum TaxID=1619310 RepID=A0ABQ2BPU5_9BACL|nr:DUF6220 domain-containing protein [Paenibacillus marchantiophytorum]GGI44745.1 hypothetical protein GCM10008018_08630 [Paenibacillus marchantiophytorum]